MERKEQKPQFVFRAEYADALNELVFNPLSSAGEERDRGVVELFKSVSGENIEWTESRFKALRKDIGNWSLDGFLIDREGRIRVGPWSTLGMYLSQEPLNLSLGNLVASMQSFDQIMIPFSPIKDSTLVWIEDHTDAILNALQNHYHEEFELEEYKAPDEIFPKRLGFLASQERKRFRMTRIKSGKIGDKRFSEAGVVRGKLGFWHNTFTGKDTYTPRVAIDSDLLSGRVYISPHPEGLLLATGRLPMDEKYSNMRVIRTDLRLAQHDFIAASLLVFEEDMKRTERKSTPFVLRYDTYTPWTGFMPQHP